MKAALLYGPGDLRIEEVAEPVAGPGEVVLAIGAAATCGTDVKSVLRGHPSIASYPARLGHEFAGVVEAVGDGRLERRARRRRVLRRLGAVRRVPPVRAGAREPVRGPAVPARRLRREAARAGAGRADEPAPAARGRAARAGAAGRAARVRGPRAGRRAGAPRRSGRDPRRRLAGADAVRARRLRGRRADRARPAPASGWRPRSASARPRRCLRRAARRTSRACAS